MAETVYLLCALTGALCSALLLRAYGNSGTRLLWWSGICFALLTANNLLVAVDLLMLPTVDLFALRNATALLAVSLLLYGLIWEAD
jgi:hypothetical protein